MNPAGSGVQAGWRGAPGSSWRSAGNRGRSWPSVQALPSMSRTWDRGIESSTEEWSWSSSEPPGQSSASFGLTGADLEQEQQGQEQEQQDMEQHDQEQQDQKQQDVEQQDQEQQDMEQQDQEQDVELLQESRGGPRAALGPGWERRGGEALALTALPAPAALTVPKALGMGIPRDGERCPCHGSGGTPSPNHDSVNTWICEHIVSFLYKGRWTCLLKSPSCVC